MNLGENSKREGLKKGIQNQAKGKVFMGQDNDDKGKR